ncbi:hypothetical protein GAS19_16035 [Burkholderia glumae]|uniref:cell division FtsA domain-containing protein n=1 Tax=Burkholderia glumae TaxID=337 RepID=UPI001294B971|nr:cell division FtsA domain-containing protein [Burkholderia glumae]QGA38993.1 hypothetical protein GAS19_16035 [Burkholderia glumae]
MADAHDQTISTSAILRTVLTTTDLRQVQEILTAEMAQQKIQALIKGTNLDRVCNRIYELAERGDQETRLTAAAVLGRLAAVARGREAQVFARLPEMLAFEPPSLDALRLLVRFIMKKAGIEPENPDRVRIQRKLELTIRDHKETLFNEGFVTIALPEIDDVMIELEEYRSLDQVKSFGISLKKTMQEILEKVDDSWTDWIVADPGRYLTVVLTGGGANLPMVRELAEGEMTVRGKKIRLVPSLAFPKWLNDDYPELEHDYPRIAVSLGGARRRLIERGGAATIAGGGVKTTPTLGGYYQKGS